MKSATTFTSNFFNIVSHKVVIVTASFAYLLLVSGSAIAATDTYTSDGVFTVPAGVNQLTVSMSGAGGGGGALSNSGAGQNGGSTSLGSLLTALGGRGGRNGSADIGGGVGGVMGGIGGQNGTNGTVLGYGGDGGNSLFGTGGLGNSNMFYRASDGTGYGAGGGGGFDGGGAGGAQAFSSTTVAVVPGQVIPVTIGVGGAGSTGDGAMAFGGNGAPGFVQISYVLDTLAPVITLNGSSTVAVGVGTTYVDAGATAFDNIDGDITANIIATSTVNANVLNTYTVSYSVSDSSGNIATTTRTVNVVDTIVPVITLLGANPQTIQFGTPYIELGATVSDNYDTGLVVNIDASAVNTVVSGTSTVTYDASDVSGNIAAQVVRTVIITAPDTIAPTDLVATSTTHTSGVISTSTTAIFEWTDSVDAGGSGLSGYSFVVDTFATTTPDNVVDTASTSTTQILAIGTTYYFHVKAIDGAGNSSQVSHIGPFAISDSQITITNSTVGGIFYELYSPSVASSTSFGITGTSTISNTTITAPFNLSNVTLNAASVSSSTLSQTTVASSTIVNAELTGCTITNSFVKNYYAVGCTVTDSLVDPVNGLNDLTGTSVSGNSSIYFSDVTYSTVVSSYVATSTISYSTLTNATSTNSTVASSTITGGSIDFSTVASSTLTNATVASSTMTDVVVLGAGSTITNSTLTGLTITDAVISNNIISSGTIVLPNGTPLVITSPTPLVTLENSAPVASFTAVSLGALQASFTDTSSDANSGTAFPDSWTYSWDFGDGSIATSSVATIGNNQTHTYSVAGTYTVGLTVADQYGLSSATSTTVTVSAVAPTTFDIFASAGANGVISPVGTTTIAQGGSQTYTISPNFGFDIFSLLIDGTSTATTTSYTFSNVQASHTIDATFATSTATSTPDTVAPVISLLGLNPVSIVVGNSYVDAGATALDNIDGDITANITTIDNVSTSTPGIYSVDYSVSDVAGNIATSTRTVNVLAVADVTPPVITLNGTSPVSIVVNTSYSDLGATSIDNIDGNITAGIVTTNPVDITTVGAYTVLYSSTDSSGNTATSTRTVDVTAAPVADVTSPSAPVVSGVNTVATTTLSATLTAIWSDATDNSGSVAGYSYIWDSSVSTTPDNIVEGQATSTTATLANGTWYFHVVAIDPSLNVSTPTSTFGPIIIDNAPAGDTTIPAGPTLITSSTHVAGVTSTSTAVSLAWDTATDNVSLAGYSYIWDVNASTTPDNIADTSATSLATNLPNGTWYFHMVSTDASGNISTPVVDFGPIIIVTTTTDVTVPTGPTAVTSLSHSASVASTNQNVNVSWDTATDETALAGYSYIWDSATSTTPDMIAETTNTAVSTMLPNGTWYFHIASVDTAGNISSPVVDFGPIIINTAMPSDVTPPSAPVVTVTSGGSTILNADWTISTDDSGSLAGYSYIWDSATSTIPDSITETQSTSTVATLPDGIWYFHLVAVDPSLNISTPVTNAGPFTIDTTAPVLSLVGSTVVPVVIGTTYTDAGATALDNVDGNITANIVATSTVNINALGTYTVTYSVSDSLGNVAASIIRTVHVIPVPDIILPVITISGATSTNVVQGNPYTDLGATATDNVDGNITANIITSNSVDTNVVGVYSVTYTVADSSGNIATASRTVNVLAPVYFNLFADTVGNGTISPSATTTILQGNNQTYVITPNFGHEISSLLIDGVSVATSTSYTFTNVQSDHTLSATFTQIATAPMFNIVASAGVNGTISSVGTTTIQQGNNLAYTITPDAGYSIISLTIDGVATTTSTMFTFSNINADHTIDVSFADLVAPVGPTIVTSSSHTASALSANQTVDVAWGIATDNVAIAGYSFVWDNNVSTTPDNIVDATSTSLTTNLAYGTWYFHVVSVDTAGNVSNPVVSYGPVVISDSPIMITNSTIGGTLYSAFSPTVASSTSLGVTGTSTLVNSSLVSSWNIVNTSITNSTLTQATTTDSTISNATLTNVVASSTTITGGTISNATIDNSTLTNVQVVGTGSTIANSTLANTTVTDAVVTNGVMSSGTIVLPNGTPFVVSTSTPLTDLVNYAPVASFTTSVNGLTATISDTTTDPNSASPNDSWVYNWNYGDGVSLTTATLYAIGNNQSHTYANSGTYTITLTVTDQNGYGLSSVTTTNVTVVAPATNGNGGGGSYVNTVSGSSGSTYYSHPAIVGDVNNDGNLDLMDFNTLLVQWGNRGSNYITDFNKDGLVDLSDFSLFLSYWIKK